MTQKSPKNKEQPSTSTTEGKVQLVSFLNLDIPLNVISEMEKFKAMPENQEAINDGAPFVEVMLQFGPMTIEMSMIDFIRKLGLLPENHDPIKPLKTKKG